VVPYSEKKLRLFTGVAPHTKSKGSQWAVTYSVKTYAFYTCSTVYKKQGAPHQRSLIQQKLMLFTRVVPRTKSKGLPIDAPHNFYYFHHALRRVQKERGSIGMCSKVIILLIKFSKVLQFSGCHHPFVSSKHKSSDPDRWFNILLVYSCYQYIRSKGHLYIYLSSSSLFSKQTKKTLQSLGAFVVIGLDKTSKII
jgi:hypothetical protein